MANGNGRTIVAIILGLRLIVTLNCSAAEVRDANSLESVENVDSGDENFRDLQSQRENMLSLYQKGMLSEFSRIVDTACDYLARLRLITENGEMIIKSKIELFKKFNLLPQTTTLSHFSTASSSPRSMIPTSSIISTRYLRIESVSPPAPTTTSISRRSATRSSTSLDFTRGVVNVRHRCCSKETMDRQRLCNVHRSIHGLDGDRKFKCKLPKKTMSNQVQVSLS